MPSIPFCDLKAQYQHYKTEIDAAIEGVLDSCHFIMGDTVTKLDQALAEYCGAKYAISCASGTDALLLALMAMDIQADDEVITTPFTFFATAEMIALLKGKPVFVDIDERSYNLNPALLEAAVSEKTRAIVPVSLYGQPPDMDAINAIAQRASEKYGHKIYVIEDAAQSFGASYKGRKSCNLSELAFSSFFPSKPLGCYGDGGAVFTNNDKLAAILMQLRVHGESKRYHHQRIGINGRMDAMQAAILCVKLKYLDHEIAQRQRIASTYNEGLKMTKVICPKINSDCNSAFAQYSIRVHKREQVVERLQAAGVPTAVHYPMPLHKQPALEYLGYDAGDFPIANKIADEILSLPMCAFLSEADQDTVVAALNAI